MNRQATSSAAFGKSLRQLASALEPAAATVMAGERIPA